ncbi:hypothetical protein [Flavobacterium marginilacus]|uniref:hypothetical protein n=1 Tax=Flavobacterium marginilacus TaxID=3003256 RepID=UPI00248F1438|nr:hypothetical protein [Flavobacterium marginilacus]
MHLYVESTKENIILNNQNAFNYKKEGNHFSISTLKNVEIISGDISSLGDGKFSNIITFIPQNKTFSNGKIIGRNQLIFALAENNVINKDFTIDETKLNDFLKKYNEIK